MQIKIKSTFDYYTFMSLLLLILITIFSVEFNILYLLVPILFIFLCYQALKTKVYKIHFLFEENQIKIFSKNIFIKKEKVIWLDSLKFKITKTQYKRSSYIGVVIFSQKVKYKFVATEAEFKEIDILNMIDFAFENKLNVIRDKNMIKYYEKLKLNYPEFIRIEDN